MLQKSLLILTVVLIKSKKMINRKGLLLPEVILFYFSDTLQMIQNIRLQQFQYFIKVFSNKSEYN